MHHHWENHWAHQAGHREAVSYLRLSSPFQKTAGEERNQVSSTYQAQSDMVKQVNVLEVKIQYPKQARRNDLQFW